MRQQTLLTLAMGSLLIAQTAGSQTGPHLRADFFERISNMTEPRWLHCATRLSDGRVFLAGGSPGSLDLQLDTAEIFHPETRQFEAIAEKMTSRRGRGVQCVTLTDGRVLIAGGSLFRFTYTDSAEIFDPNAPLGSQFTAVGDMRSVRGPGWSALPQPDNTALLFGGVYEGDLGTATDKIDRFVPSGGGGSFFDAGTLADARRDYSATQIDGDTVLLVAGVRRFDQGVSIEAERYGIAAEEAVATAGQPNHRPRGRDAATASLPSGNALLVGGDEPAEIYLSATDSFVDLANSPVYYSSTYLQAVTLLDSRVLVLGAGRTRQSKGRVGELFTMVASVKGSFKRLGSFKVPSVCDGFAATLLKDGSVLITGGGSLNAAGDSCENALATAELFHPGR